LKNNQLNFKKYKVVEFKEKSEKILEFRLIVKSVWLKWVKS